MGITACKAEFPRSGSVSLEMLPEPFVRDNGSPAEGGTIRPYGLFQISDSLLV